MTVGGCYFPEHWPRERWATDVERMAEADIEYVRMGEFARSCIEPEPGNVQLDWLEAAVDLVHGQGMAAVLCPPTATLPKWLDDATVLADPTWVRNFAPAPVQGHAADAEWVVGDGTVQGYDASVVTVPPHELTVERTG